MKKNICAFGTVLLIFSCTEKHSDAVPVSKDVPPVAETHQAVQPSSTETCYAGNTGKDSVFISIDDNLGTLTGKLEYRNFEKDVSKGNLIGMKSGDTLKFSYSFSSEGKQSDREIYFLKKDNTLIEGIGEYKVDGTQDLYANPAAVKFTGQVLKQEDCSAVLSKFSK